MKRIYDMQYNIDNLFATVHTAAATTFYNCESDVKWWIISHLYLQIVSS